MKKKVAGFMLAALMMFSTLSGVQADDTAWSNQMEASQMEEAQGETENTEEGNVETSEPETDDEMNGEMEEEADTGQEDIIEEIPEEDEEIDVSYEMDSDEEDSDDETEDEFSAVEFEDDSDTEEIFSDDAGQISTQSTVNVPVQWVDANYKMRSEYAFSYAFKTGVTELSYISRHNSGLNTKVHNWFGDSVGYTEEYCKRFYACAIDSDKYKDPITAIYSNVGEYQGKIVDLKVTAVRWGSISNNHVGNDGTKMIPCILFYKNTIAFNTIAVSAVRFQFEFLKHGTDQKVYPKGHITVADLDGGQGISVRDNWNVDRIYLRKGYNYLSVTDGTLSDGTPYREIGSKEGSGSLGNGDVQGWCQLDFNGSFSLSWLSQDSWKNGTGPQNAFFISTSKSVGTYEPNPGPEKRVGKENAYFSVMTKHEFTADDPPFEITEGKNFDYMIRQRIMPGSYSSFVLKDTLDPCIKYRSASVITAAGTNVTNKFKIEKSGNTLVFTANTAFLKTPEAYNDVYYYFRIKVKAGTIKEMEAHNHYRKADGFYAIVNTASRTIVSDKMQDTKTTNKSWVKMNPVTTDGMITITKKINESDITWAHGNPVFRFSITGQDQQGISHVYENYVEFEPGVYSVSGEDAVMSCYFTDIPPGRYTISELQTLRYQFESITADTSNVSVSGKTGMAVIDAANQTAAVTFRNKKTRYDRYSHTNVVRNIIPVSES